LELKPHTSTPLAWHSSVCNWDDTGPPVSEFHESWFSHIEMGSRRIAPTTSVGVLVPIRRAKIGGCDHC
jgi:hypothetical protein